MASRFREHLHAFPQKCILNSSSSFTFRRDITRDVMADRLAAVFKTVNTQFELIAHLESEAQKLKSDLIVKQEQVIGLEEQLIADKETQLKEFKETVVSSVGDTVQTQLKSHSDAVQGQLTSDTGALVEEWGVAKGPWPHLKFGGRGQRILWPHLNFGQILTKIDLTLMIICEKTRNFL